MGKRNKPRLYIMSGPPASGKSTYVDGLPDDVVRISPDNFVYNDEGIYEWTPKRSNAAWKRAHDLLAQTLVEGKSCVFDATFTGSKRRRKFFNQISKYKGFDNYWVVAVCAPVLPLTVLIERNSTRSPDRQVPYNTIKQMLESYSVDGPKSDEGFDEVIYI